MLYESSWLKQDKMADNANALDGVNAPANVNVPAANDDPMSEDEVRAFP